MSAAACHGPCDGHLCHAGTDTHLNTHLQRTSCVLTVAGRHALAEAVRHLPRLEVIEVSGLFFDSTVLTGFMSTDSSATAAVIKAMSCKAELAQASRSDVAGAECISVQPLKIILRRTWANGENSLGEARGKQRIQDVQAAWEALPPIGQASVKLEVKNGLRKRSQPLPIPHRSSRTTDGWNMEALSRVQEVGYCSSVCRH